MTSTIRYEDELVAVLEAIAASDTDKARLGKLLPEGDATEEIETFEEAVPFPTLVELPVSRVTVKNLFSHPDAHPLILDLALLKTFGGDWLLWEPETLRHFTTGDIGPISDLNFSKAMAMKTLHLVDSFWMGWEVFTWCTMPLNGLFPDFKVMQVPSVAQCAVAIDIANRVRENVKWSKELLEYLKVAHQHDGIFYTQPPLEFISMEDMGPVMDGEDIKRRWNDVRRSGKAPTGATDEDEQLRRMLAVYEHLSESRLRLRQQLPLIHYA